MVITRLPTSIFSKDSYADSTLYTAIRYSVLGSSKMIQQYASIKKMTKWRPSQNTPIDQKIPYNAYGELPR